MTLSRVPAVRVVSDTIAQTVGIGHQAATIAADSLLRLAAEATTRSLQVSRTVFSVLTSTGPAAQDLGVCPICDRPVTNRDPFIRYLGEYFHAAGCAESNPPALRARTVCAPPGH